jgi:predicted transcriptional regulator
MTIKGYNRNGTESKRVAREKMVWELYIKRGWPQHEIASHLGITQSGVSKIVTRITKQYAENNLADVKAEKEKQLAQYENNAKELQEAWHKSKEPSVVKTQKKKDGFFGKGGGKATEGIYKEENKHGDPRYLELWRKLKEDMRKMSGVDMIGDIEDDIPISKIQIEVIDPEKVKANVVETD